MNALCWVCNRSGSCNRIGRETFDCDLWLRFLADNGLDKPGALPEKDEQGEKDHDG